MPENHDIPPPTPPPPPPKQPKQPVMHALGQSLGILWKALREPVKPADKIPASTPDDSDPNQEKTERRVLEQETRQLEQGNITLRETTIREIEVAPPKTPETETPPPPPPPPPPTPDP